MTEMITAYSCDTRKARKDHTCCECQCVIKKGEKYHYHHGIFDGRGVSYKVCLDCDELRDKIHSEQEICESDIIYFGGLGEEVYDGEGDYLVDFLEIIKKRGGKLPPGYK